MKKFITIISVAIAALIMFNSCACTIVDNSEVGIKFNKFSVTEQGKLEATSVTGYCWYK